MTPTLDEVIVLYHAGLTERQINALLFWRWRLYRDGYSGNVLATPAVLRTRQGSWGSERMEPWPLP